jgi:CRISPR/Cas system CSM-associated protein Csm3 (group 7 of RAMP superfamily)
MYQVKFNIHTYWRAGTGRGGVALLDEMVHKDAYGLPSLPGRTVKGLLRDAVFRAEEWGQIPQGSTINWFGGNALENGQLESRLEIKPGALAVSDALLDDAVRKYLIYLLKDKSRQSKGKSLRQGFFHQIYATAIENGSAKDKSLRGMEVTIPLTLTAKLHVLQPLNDEHWVNDLKKCLPLIRALGTSRSRGLGRVTVELIESNESSTI